LKEGLKIVFIRELDMHKIKIFETKFLKIRVKYINMKNLGYFM